jgi:hypothetical protein
MQQLRVSGTGESETTQRAIILVLKRVKWVKYKRELVEGTYGLGQVQKNVPDDLGTFQLI